MYNKNKYKKEKNRQENIYIRYKAYTKKKRKIHTEMDGSNQFST